MLEAYIHNCGIIFVHRKTVLVTQTLRGIRKLIAYYRLTCLIFPIAVEEVMYVYVKKLRLSKVKYVEELICRSDF